MFQVQHQRQVQEVEKWWRDKAEQEQRVLYARICELEQMLTMTRVGGGSGYIVWRVCTTLLIFVLAGMISRLATLGGKARIGIRNFASDTFWRELTCVHLLYFLAGRDTSSGLPRERSVVDKLVARYLYAWGCWITWRAIRWRTFGALALLLVFVSIFTTSGNNLSSFQDVVWTCHAIPFRVDVTSPYDVAVLTSGSASDWLVTPSYLF